MKLSVENVMLLVRSRRLRTLLLVSAFAMCVRAGLIFSLVASIPMVYAGKSGTAEVTSHKSQEVAHHEVDAGWPTIQGLIDCALRNATPAPTLEQKDESAAPMHFSSTNAMIAIGSFAVLAYCLYLNSKRLRKRWIRHMRVRMLMAAVVSQSSWIERIPVLNEFGQPEMEGEFVKTTSEVNWRASYEVRVASLVRYIRHEMGLLPRQTKANQHAVDSHIKAFFKNKLLKDVREMQRLQISADARTLVFLPNPFDMVASRTAEDQIYLEKAAKYFRRVQAPD